jgi:hypothetical protein
MDQQWHLTTIDLRFLVGASSAAAAVSILDEVLDTALQTAGESVDDGDHDDDGRFPCHRRTVLRYGAATEFRSALDELTAGVEQALPSGVTLISVTAPDSTIDLLAAV